MLIKENGKRLVDISFVLKFDHLKSYLCKASELRKSEISFNLDPSDSIPDVFWFGLTSEGMKVSISVRFFFP